VSNPLAVPQKSSTPSHPVSILEVWAKPYKVNKAGVEYAQQLARNMGWDRPAGRPRKPYDLVPYIADLQQQYDQVAAEVEEFKKNRMSRA
jgi:hypothetical protein